MALASLVAISGPKKFSTFRARLFPPDLEMDLPTSNSLNDSSFIVISVVLGTEEREVPGGGGGGGFTLTILKEKASRTPKQTFDEKNTCILK